MVVVLERALIVFSFLHWIDDVTSEIVHSVGTTLEIRFQITELVIAIAKIIHATIPKVAQLVRVTPRSVLGLIVLGQVLEILILFEAEISFVAMVFSAI